MKYLRPQFLQAQMRFYEVKVPVPEVGRIIGGKVKVNIDSGIFTNACAIRMSYVLNYSGVPIPNTGYDVVSGHDKKWYIFRVVQMHQFIERVFGVADLRIESPTPDKFTNSKGILFIQGHGWNDANGHFTMWDGTACGDTCHFVGDPENHTFVPAVGLLWKLPSEVSNPVRAEK